MTAAPREEVRELLEAELSAARDHLALVRTTIADLTALTRSALARCDDAMEKASS